MSPKAVASTAEPGAKAATSATGQESQRKTGPVNKLQLPTKAAGENSKAKGGQASQRKAGPLGGLRLPSSSSKADAGGGQSSQRGASPFAASASGSTSHRSSGGESSSNRGKGEASQLSNRKAAPKLKLPEGGGAGASTSQTSNRKGPPASGPASHRKAAGATSNRKGKSGAKGSSSERKASGGKKRKANSSAVAGEDDNLEELDDVDEGVEDGSGVLPAHAANPPRASMEGAAGLGVAPGGEARLAAPVPAYMHDQLQAAIKAGDNDLVEELLDCLRELAKVDGVSDMLGDGEAGAGSLGPTPEAPVSGPAASRAAAELARMQRWANVSIGVGDDCRASIVISVADPSEKARARTLSRAPAPADGQLGSAAGGGSEPTAEGSSAPISKEEAARLLAGLLVEALHRTYARVIDLFRSWDEDGDGSVSKLEFRHALPLLQQNGEVSLAEVDALFDSFDVDGSGAITYKELYGELKASAKASPPTPRLSTPRQRPTPRGSEGSSHPKGTPRSRSTPRKAATPREAKGKPATPREAKGKPATPSGTPRKLAAAAGGSTPRKPTAKAANAPAEATGAGGSGGGEGDGNAMVAGVAAATGIVINAAEAAAKAAAGAAAAALGRLATLDFKFLPNGEVALDINVLRDDPVKQPKPSPPAANAAAVPKLSIPERMALEDKTNAAILLQRVHRGKSCRLDVAKRREAAIAAVPKLSIPERMALEDKTNAAILLQRVHRGKSCRLDVAKRREAAIAAVPKLSIPERMALEDKTNAAILLQRVHRGKSCRLDVAKRRQSLAEAASAQELAPSAAAQAHAEAQGAAFREASASLAAPFQVQLDVSSSGAIVVNVLVVDGSSPLPAAAEPIGEPAAPAAAVAPPSVSATAKTVVASAVAAVVDKVASSTAGSACAAAAGEGGQDALAETVIAVGADSSVRVSITPSASPQAQRPKAGAAAAHGSYEVMLALDDAGELTLKILPQPSS